MSFSPLTPSVGPSPLTPVVPYEPPYILELLAGLSNYATTAAPTLMFAGINVYYAMATRVDAAFLGVQALLLFALAKYSTGTPTQFSWDLLKSSAFVVAALYGLYSIYRALRA